MGDAHVRGKVVTFALEKLRPNDWNPNVVTPEKMASIEYGFRTDGWLASQALLVWRKDDKGKTRNIIIDGEHRWKAGVAVGLAEGPVVFLDGLTELDAKALTIKLNQKRGEWDEDALGKLLREVQGSSENVALDFGFDGSELNRLLAESLEARPPAQAFSTPPILGVPAASGGSPVNSGSFLDAFDPQKAQLKDGGAPNEDAFFTFALKLTSEQDKAVQETIKTAKQVFGVNTNLEAILAVFAQFMKGKSS